MLAILGNIFGDRDFLVGAIASKIVTQCVHGVLIHLHILADNEPIRYDIWLHEID